MSKPDLTLVKQGVMPQTPQPTATGSKPVVLVADDSRMVRISVRQVLKKEFEILEAEDGEAAWELLQQHPEIQVLLTDQGMPRLDGHGLISRCRASDKAQLAQLPIMLITGAEENDLEAKQKALDVGATDFILKPFDKAELLARTRAHARLDETSRSLSETQTQLKKQAVKDALTGSYNQNYFMERGEQTISYAMRHNQDLSVLSLQIDRHEELQLEYSSEIYQDILKWVAEHISNGLRKEDIAAHLKSGHFGILLPSTHIDAAYTAGERIIKRIMDKHYSRTVIALPITLSIGVTSLQPPAGKAAENFKSFFDQANEHLQQALNKGGNQLAPPKPKACRTRKLISIDSALKLFHSKSRDNLRSHLPLIAGTIMPLLEYCNDKLNWGLSQEIARIKEKLDQ